MPRNTPKYRFLHAMAGISPLLPLGLMRRLSGHSVIMPFYHTVGNGHLPHIAPLYPYREAKAFRADMEFLARHFSPLGTDQWLAMQAGNRPPKPGFLLSFDDGLRGVYELAAPMLREMGIPAIVFLNTGFVGNKRLFFKHKAALLFRRWQETPHPPSEAAQKLYAGAGLPVAGPFPDALLQIPCRHDKLLDNLAALLGVDFTAFLQGQKPYLEWDEVRALQEMGFAIGTHTEGHPLLARLPLQQQLDEVARPYAHLRQHVDVPRHLFSFPFSDEGLSCTFFRQLFSGTPPKVDYSFAGAGLKKEAFPRHFQRIPMEFGKLGAEQIIKGEYFYYLMKAMVGKNRIKRKEA